MIFSPMNRASLSPSFSRKRNLPTPPPSLADVNDSSSSCSSNSSSSYSIPSQNDSTTTVTSCDLLDILTDVRFRPVFQAIDEIKRRKCRPDLERILKYVAKRSTRKDPSDHRNEILSILDELRKYGLITKVFHKGGFTIRIKEEKYAKLVENMNLCFNQKTPSVSSTDSSNDVILHKRETPSPEFADYPVEKSQMTKENELITMKKRSRSQTPISSPTKSKRTRPMKISDSVEQIVRKPLVIHNNLPPITIEQLLGLRGDIPDVHNWSTSNLVEFFHQQGYEYASIVLNTHEINGDKLYELKREQVFHLSTLKIGKALKLWNVIEQIQRNNLTSAS